jgi:large subunit ribosomal protein L25
MAETLVLKAETREAIGTRFARRQRKQGRVPTIIYGHKIDPVSVSLDYHDLMLELHHRHRLLDVELEGKREKFLVKAVQYDHMGDTVVHLDLVRVSLDERVAVTVEVELKGVPAGASEGGILEQLLADIQLECPVINIPDKVRMRVNHLKLNESILASDIELPEGAKLITDATATVAIVRLPSEAPEEEAAATAVVEGEAGVEPEVIGRVKPEEEEEK